MRCRIYQWRLTRALAAGEPLSAGLRRHVAACDRCRRVHAEMQAIGQVLRDDVPAAAPLPAALRRRIVDAARPGRTVEPPPAPRPWFGPAAGLAAAACLVVGVALLSMGPPREPGQSGAGTTAPVVASAPLPGPPGPDALTEPFWTDIEQLTAAPVASEMERLAEDTRQFGSALLARLPLELIRAGNGKWLDSLLEDVMGPSGPVRPPASAPSRRDG